MYIKNTTVNSKIKYNRRCVKSRSKEVFEGELTAFQSRPHIQLIKEVEKLREKTISLLKNNQTMSKKIKKMKHQQQKYIELETSFNELSKKCEFQEELKVFIIYLLFDNYHL